MAAGDQYRRIEPSDMLVFDEANNLVGLRSGKSDSAELRLGAPLTAQQVGALAAVFGGVYPTWLGIGDSNGGRHFNTYNVNSGAATIVSPGLAEITFSSGTRNMPAGTQIRLNGDPAVPAFHGVKTVSSRVSSTVHRFATGESTQTAASTEAISVQVLDTPSNQGIFAYIEAYLRDKCNFVNRADGGLTTTDNLARLPAYLAETRPSVVVLQSGTNDLTASETGDAILGRIRQMGELVRAAGAVFVVGTLLPRGSGTASTDMAAATRIVNAGLLADQRAGLCFVADVLWPTVDPSTLATTLTAETNSLADASHCTQRGAVASFLAYRPILDKLLGTAPTVQTLTADGLANLTTNGFFADTTGISESSSASTTTLAVEENPHGPGNRLVITCAASGVNTTTVSLPTIHAATTPSHRYRMRMRLELTSAVNVRSVTVPIGITASWLTQPALLNVNNTTSGATGYGVRPFPALMLETEFVTHSAAATNSTASIVIVHGAAGSSVVKASEWTLVDLGTA